MKLLHFGSKLIDFAEFLSFSIIFVKKRKKNHNSFIQRQISIIMEDSIRLWRLYFCPQINRRGDTAIRYLRVNKEEFKLSRNTFHIFQIKLNSYFVKGRAQRCNRKHNHWYKILISSLLYFSWIRIFEKCYDNNKFKITQS